MKCGQCGAEVAKGETFCQVCGARVNSAAVEKKPEVESRPESKPAPTEEQPKEQKRSKKGGNKKLTVIAMIGILIALAAVALTIVLAKMGNSNVLERDIARPYLVVTETNSGKEKMAVFGDGIRFADSEEGGKYDESSWNGTSTLVDEEGKLYVMTFEGVELADTSVYCAYVSADGSYVAYLKGFSNDVGNLYTYNVDKGSRTAVDTGVLDSIVLSPNGSTICYTAYDEASDAHHVRMSRGQKKGERVLDCESVLAVNDDGSRMFFVNNGKVYEMIDGTRTRICEMDEIDAGLGVMFNADCTEMLYQLSPESSEQHIFTEGEKLDIPWISYYMREPLVVKDDIGGSQSGVLRIRSFRETLLWGYGGIVENFRPLYHLIRGSETDDAIASADGKKFAITRGGYVSVFKVKDGDEATEALSGFDLESKPTKLYGDAKLENIYFTNERDELWHIHGKKLSMVSADVSMVAMSESGELYFMYDGVVLCRADGSERVSIERNTNVKDIVPAPNGVVVVTGAREYYRDGVKVDWIDWRIKEASAQ